MVIPTNASAAEYEAIMQYKVMILLGLFYARKESSMDAKSDFFAYIREYMQNQSADFNYRGALATSFFANQATIHSLMSENLDIVKGTLQHLLVTCEKIAPNSLFSVDHQGFQDDLVYLKLRQIVMSLVNSDNVDLDLKTICVKLLLSWGLARASAEDLLLATQL